MYPLYTRVLSASSPYMHDVIYALMILEEYPNSFHHRSETLFKRVIPYNVGYFFQRCVSHFICFAEYPCVLSSQRYILSARYSRSIRDSVPV